MANVKQRTSGKWQAKIRRTGFPDQSKSFDKKSDAERWARALEREMDIGAFIKRDDSERTTFKVAAERYKKEILPTKRSIQQAQSVIKLLSEHFGKFSLASINAAMISKFRDDRLKCVKPQTVVHEINMISRIYKAAMLDWGIAIPQGVPTVAVRKPRIDNARDRRLEPGEWVLLSEALSQCASSVPLAVAEFAIETAARLSEIMSLQCSDVDLNMRKAKLRGVGGRSTKNNDSFREIPLTTRAGDILSAQPRSIRKTGRVFNTTQGAFVQSWDRAVKRARKSHVRAILFEKLRELGLDSDREISALIYKKRSPDPRTMVLLNEIENGDKMLLDLHFHDLRHEATSRLAEMLQMHELMKVTGHKSSGMLARYYHPRAEDLARKLG